MSNPSRNSIALYVGLVLPVLSCSSNVSDRYGLSGAELVGTETPIIVDTYNNAREIPIRIDGTVCFRSDARACQFKKIMFALPLQNGHVVLADGTSMIHEFSLSKDSLVRTFGRKGAGPGETQIIGGITERPDGGLRVLDVAGFRVLEFDSVGTHLRTTNGTFDANTKDVRFLGSGYAQLLLPGADTVGQLVTGRVVKWDFAGDTTSIATFPARSVSKRGSGSIAAQPPFTPRLLWDFDGDSTIAIASGASFEVAVFSASRAKFLIRSDLPPQPLTDEEVAQTRFEMLNPGGRPTAASGYNAQAEAMLAQMPEVRPPISQLRVTANHYIWIRSSAKIPARGTLQPMSRWDIFDENGARMGYVLLNASSRFLHSHLGQIFIADQDENGREYLGIYQMLPPSSAPSH